MVAEKLRSVQGFARAYIELIMAVWKKSHCKTQVFQWQSPGVDWPVGG